jgi:hypothetical protein
MNEFCAGVKILLERMKSNPEDFEVIDFNAATYKSIDGRFYDFAKLLAKVISCDDDKAISWQEWRYFTEEERQALVAGFTEMQRAKFDKEIMERVFDDQYIERQRKEQQSIYTQKVHAAQMQAAQIQGHTNITQTIQPMHGGGGLMNAMGLGGIFK